MPSTTAASASDIRSSVSQVDSGTRSPAASASTAARAPAPARRPWYSVASSRLSAGVEGVVVQLVSSSAAARPSARRPTRGTSRTRTRRQLPGGLGDHVVVRRRSVAAGSAASHRWWCQIWCSASRVVLEQPGGARPAASSLRTHTHGDQPDAQLDAADPVHAAERRVGRPPRREVLGDAVGVAVVAGQA